MKMSLGTKILIAAVSVLGAATLAVLGAIYIPQMLDNSGAANTTSPGGATSMATLIQAPPVQDGFAEEHEIALTVNGEEYTGTYEGEYANGSFLASVCVFPPFSGRFFHITTDRISYLQVDRFSTIFSSLFGPFLD